jgi:hypothetical protein
MSNMGINAFKTDPNNDAVIVLISGQYRVTGRIEGDIPADSLVQGYVNYPCGQLAAQGQEPSYGFPLYFGSAQRTSAGRVSLPFRGAIAASSKAPLSFYFSETFTSATPTQEFRLS